MSSAKKISLDLETSSRNEKKSEVPKKKSKYSIYYIVNIKIFFKNKIKSNRNKPAKQNALSEKQQINKQPALEFVFTVTDFDKEQVEKATSYIRSSNYFEALAILEPISKQQSSDHEVLFWVGHCHEKLQNYELAEKHYKICADYILDDGHWETTYGKFLLEHSNLNDSDDPNSTKERVRQGMKRLKSSADRKRYVTAMYILGKIYISGLFGIEQDLNEGELYLKRAYNGGKKEKAWAIYEKKAKELVANGRLKEVPRERAWAKS